MIPALEPLEAYAEACSSPEPKILSQLREEAYRTQALPQQIAGPLQGRFLSLLTKISRTHHVLEIGTFVGYSALCFAEALPKDGHVITLDCDPSIVPIAKRYFSKVPYGRKITLKMGKALDLIRELEGPFDLVYIDADKVNYSRYYDAVFKKVPSGGLIVADNLLWGGAVLDKRARDSDTQALRDFAKKVRADRRVESILLPLRDGLLLIRKR